jgi:epoxyqueuosine reductase
VDVRARTESVRARARALGFHKVGVARADDADPDRRLAVWLERGFGGELEYMRRTARERTDPRLLVEGAASVVSLAISYYDPDYEPEGDAKVSRYAVSDDYHIVVRKKVRKLRRHILELDPTARVHPAVDTSPILERAWAERAGIAWIGKSTMAIAQDLGTYTFLATLVTTMELEYDDPHPDRCGSCTACIDACPTEAFRGPYELDATKCITYWNVETRAPFPVDTPEFFGWAAGCDVCQEVCPWNKFARPTDEPRFRPRRSLTSLDAEALSDPARAAELAATIRGTALQRTGENAMRRNLLHLRTRRSP